MFVIFVALVVVIVDASSCAATALAAADGDCVNSNGAGVYGESGVVVDTVFIIIAVNMKLR